MQSKLCESETVSCLISHLGHFGVMHMTPNSKKFLTPFAKPDLYKSFAMQMGDGTEPTEDQILIEEENGESSDPAQPDQASTQCTALSAD